MLVIREALAPMMNARIMNAAVYASCQQRSAPTAESPSDTTQASIFLASARSQLQWGKLYARPTACEQCGNNNSQKIHSFASVGKRTTYSEKSDANESSAKTLVRKHRSNTKFADVSQMKNGFKTLMPSKGITQW